jgi:FemAB-related protein (PEP-CTERM system-associated)
MRVVHCDQSHKEAWNAFLGTAPEASFYHRFEWSTINRTCFGHQTAYLAALADNGEIAGVFPLVRLRSRLFGNLACSMPFVNYGGICAVSPQVEDQLIAEAIHVIDDWKVDYAEIRSRRDLGSRFTTSQHKVSMTVGLNPDPEVLWGKFKTAHRQDIRRGYKNGFAARFGGAELIDDFYALLSETWRDLGTPIYRKQYLSTVSAAFPDRVRICIVHRNGEPAAGAFIGEHGGTVEGMWLATRAQFRKQHAGYVLYWELIKSACERGFQHFHLGRSTVESGGETFKKKWNAETLPLYWQYILRTREEIPELNVTNPRYRLAISAWRKLPIPITQMVGPIVARSIP